MRLNNIYLPLSSYLFLKENIKKYEISGKTKKRPLRTKNNNKFV